jgi:hypothetical protein
MPSLYLCLTPTAGDWIPRFPASPPLASTAASSSFLLHSTGEQAALAESPVDPVGGANGGGGAELVYTWFATAVAATATGVWWLCAGLLYSIEVVCQSEWAPQSSFNVADHGGIPLAGLTTDGRRAAPFSRLTTRLVDNRRSVSL